MLPQLRPFPEVAATVQTLLAQVRSILGSQFCGFYLHGSLALGDFAPETSDIDFVVVTDGPLGDEAVAALTAMHARLSAGDSKWGHELEGDYVPQQILRRYDPDSATFPRIERGGRLSVEAHDSAWLIQCHTLRRCGIVLAGPPPHTLLDPIPPDTLRQAVLDLLWWWEVQLDDTWRVEQDGYQAYAILTMCRILYTMREGTIVSKPVAARWARARLDAPWPDLINRALQWQPGIAMNALSETLDFIASTVREARRIGI